MRRIYFQFDILLLHSCLNDPRIQYQEEDVEEGIRTFYFLSYI